MGIIDDRSGKDALCGPFNLDSLHFLTVSPLPFAQSKARKQTPSISHPHPRRERGACLPERCTSPFTLKKASTHQTLVAQIAIRVPIHETAGRPAGTARKGDLYAATSKSYYQTLRRRVRKPVRWRHGAMLLIRLQAVSLSKSLKVAPGRPR